jgi:outer membrane protein
MRLLSIFLVCISGASTLLAQTNDSPVRRLSLEDCIEIALRHNLDVQITRFSPELARYTLNASYGAYDPNFSIGGAHSYNRSPGGFDEQGRPFGATESDANSFNSGVQGLLPWGTTYNLGAQVNDTFGTRPGSVLDARENFESVNGQVSVFQLRQPFLKNFWIDNTRLQMMLAKKNVQISELDLRQQVMTSVTAVEVAYFNLIFARENVGVQRKALELAEQLLAENRKRVEVGAMAPLDEKQAEAQAAGSRAELLSAEGNADTQQRVLKNLLSDNYDLWKAAYIQPTINLIAIPETFDLQESWRKGLTQRPDVLQQKLALEKQGYVIRYQKNQMYPQLDLVGNAGYTASSRTSFDDALDQIGGRDNPAWSVGGQLTIPLGNTSAKNNLRAARATLDQINLQLKQLQQRVLIKIEDDIASAKTTFQQVQATREARIYAEAALEAEQKKLESGKSTSFEVLRLQRDLTTARSNEIRALADYNNALAQIALDEGSTLERRHITVEAR